MQKGVIYRIFHTFNSQCYIGLAENFEARKKAHLNAAKKGVVSKLYTAMRAIGIEHFKFEVLEQCPLQILGDREKHWIRHFDSYENGYNATTGGGSAIPVEVYSGGKRVFIFDSIFECEKTLGIANIKTKGHFKGFTFVRKGEQPPLQIMPPKIEVWKDDKMVAVCADTKEASALTGAARSNINWAANTSGTAKGYRFNYEGKKYIPATPPRKIEIWKDGKRVKIVDGSRAAADFTGASQSAIGGVLAGRSTHAKGWGFKWHKK